MTGTSYDNTQHTESVGYRRPPYETASEIVRAAGRHPLYLWATIIYTVMTAIGSFIDGIPSILGLIVMISLWKFYTICKNETEPFSLDTSPLKTIKIIKILSLIAYSIYAIMVAAFLEITSERYVALGSRFGSDTIAYSIMYLSFVLVFLTISIMINVGSMCILSSAVTSSKTGLKPKSAGKLTPVLMIIHGILYILAIVIIILMSGSVTQTCRELSGRTDLSDAIMYIVRPLSDPSSSSFVLVVMQYLFCGISTIMFGCVLLDIINKVKGSYYPTPEEAYYNVSTYEAAKREWAFAQMKAHYEERARYYERYMQQQQRYAEYQRSLRYQQYGNYPPYAPYQTYQDQNAQYQHSPQYPQYPQYQNYQASGQTYGNYGQKN